MTTRKLKIRRRLDDIETPVSAMLKLDPNNAGTFLFESVLGGEQRGRYSFIGTKPDLWWRVSEGFAQTSPNRSFDDVTFESDDPMQDVRRFIDECHVDIDDDEDVPPMIAGAFGYLGYDMIRYVETLPPAPEDTLQVPEAMLMRPTVILIFDSVKQEIILATPLDEGDDVAADKRLDEIEELLDSPLGVSRPIDRDLAPLEFTSNTTKLRFEDMVRKAQEYILAGDIFQVVPSQRFTVDFETSPFALYRALRRLNPSPFLFYVNLGEFQVIGSSPEILVRVRNNTVSIRPIAGTLPRGNTPEEDRKNEETLLADPKELAEHLMLLDLGRNDVGRVAKYGSVNVTEEFIIERYSHVMHIVSNVEGELRDDQDAVSALMGGFPAGTVSGAPKIRAMEIINELETNKRGVYGGGVGYFGTNGDMDVCIALRTAVIKDKKLHVQAGAGVVMDSKPEKEFQETVHKANALMKAAQEAARYDGANR
ncbi:anthranilate synthase component I [Hirschia maritima]|uniref:anthranilate synthase component I n=1 Tax=Hirschia maritima TaxID=1121961 RepID=UPI0004775B7C|nr:anthranilate synthase component I [Hirschia maritima]